MHSWGNHILAPIGSLLGLFSASGRAAVVDAELVRHLMSVDSRSRPTRLGSQCAIRPFCHIPDIVVHTQKHLHMVMCVSSSLRCIDHYVALHSTAGRKIFKGKLLFRTPSQYTSRDHDLHDLICIDLRRTPLSLRTTKHSTCEAQHAHSVVITLALCVQSSCEGEQDTH